jgi:hypothetical protein
VIPLVHPADNEKLWRVWPDVAFDTIAVNYLSLKNRRRLYLAARESGIRKALQFDGACVSVLVGRNWLLDQTSVKSYVQDVTRMGFDAATTHDDFLYWPDPPSFRWSRIHKSIDRARELVSLNPDFDIIGIVKGSTPTEIEFSLEKLQEMDIQRVAFPCSELCFERRHDDINWFLRKAATLGQWRWLIGVGSPWLMSRFGADCYSSVEWCYSSTLGVEFSHYGTRHTNTYPNCGHSLCNSLRQDDMPSTFVRARHNGLILNEIDTELRGIR